nr:hypothetical protein B0A51_10059 [Rachicladosporium sp. CCFEE 5018]
MPRDQAADAQHLYDDRATKYDDSWHPRFARHVVDLLDLKPGEHVLDLACGTGLVTFAAAQAVGSTGSVTGVDISSGMLAQAHLKQLNANIENVTFHQHSITSLSNLKGVQGQQFDAITCASALVLLSNPTLALKHWVRFLKPGGRLIMDVTHIRSQLGHLTLERVGKSLAIPVPSYRLNFETPQHFEDLLSAAGLQNVDIKLLSQVQANGHGEGIDAYVSGVDQPRIDRVFAIEDGQATFEKLIASRYGEALAADGVRDRARELFMEEWAKLADGHGRIEEVDGVFVGKGRKPS